MPTAAPSPSMIRTLCAFLLLLAVSGAVTAADVRIFGVQMSPMMDGGFKPAGTELQCTSLQEGQCYDDKVWHDLFPPGPHKYAADRRIT